jgi:hypothetical protein
VEDIVGIWKSRFEGHTAYMHFREDGTFRLAHDIADLGGVAQVMGDFWFEETEFHIDDPCGEGTYEVRVEKDGDQPILLIFKVIEDACIERARDLSRRMPWVEP